MNDHCEEHEFSHSHTIKEELLCHFPYAVFSVALSLAVLSFVSFFSSFNNNIDATSQGAHLLFHSFHFMHIVFAATGTLITYFRFSKSVLKGLIVGVLTASFFCTVSDSILPYIGGRMLGVDMHFHLCFWSDLDKILPFLFVGLVNGFIMSRHHSSKQSMYSTFSHFIHILISSFASMFYLVSHGFVDWGADIGFIFLFLIVAVVVPCTFSDVVVPMYFAKKADKKHEKH
ncbi:MAG: hypothetical protein NTX86_04695 [Candidatus Dependentiae bacterium]|nr:hypothetical protein [Candidatus Dependentiae bacterium]